MTRISGTENFRNMRAAMDAIAERPPGLTKPSLKRYSWSRLHSDLLDDSRWTLVAKRSGAPLPLVEALVMRLEAHANNAQPRGDVLEFNAEAMAARWNVDADMVARIYEQLEHPDIGWISQDQITSFWQRNPDKIDETNAERQRRWRARRRGMKQLAALSRIGLISERQRREREAALRDSREPEAVVATWNVTRDSVTVTPSVTRDSGTFVPDVTVSRRDPVTVTPSVMRDSGTFVPDVTVSRRDSVTVTVGPKKADRTAAERQRRKRALKKLAKLVPLEPAPIAASQRDSVTRYIVTVTPRAEQSSKQETSVTEKPAVTAEDVSQAPNHRVGFADKARALQWLHGEGEAILMRRCQVMKSKAGRMIERWCVTLAQDLTAMAEIILETSATSAQGAAFERMVVEQVARRAADMLGPALPFPLRDVKGV